MSGSTYQPCPGSTPIWYWDFASVEFNEVNGQDEYHTLIQIAGGPETDKDPGITSYLDPGRDMLYHTVKPDTVFRSLFKVKRDGQYLFLNDDDDLKTGDVLDFWSPSKPSQRKLFLSVFEPDKFGLRRVPFSEDPAAASLEVELRVRVPTLSNTKIGARTERERLSGQSPINRSTSLSFSKKKGPGCLSRLCKATASGIGGLFRGANKLFSDARKARPQSLPRDPRQFLDDLTFADRSGTGRIRLRDPANRQLTLNSEPSARSASARRQGNLREDPEPLTAAENEGASTGLPRLLNLGPSGFKRVLEFIATGDLPKITEGTEGTGIDTHVEIRTPGLYDTRPILNTMTTSRPETHGHFGSEILMSGPENPDIAENPEEEEEEDDDEEQGEEKKDEYQKEVVEGEGEDTSSLGIAISEDIDEEEDIQANSPPILFGREGGPGASKGALELSKITPTLFSQPVPAEKQLRRSNNMMESYSEEFE
ncbi:hypothetical protein TWF506_009738 [Arthrobotrys conoides]|uniref:Uncharacterized protein n=1 Tax=Arthrobotrys conoides TaxID=74498 RepID=A0AAN8N2R2_9PEZI